MSRIAHGSRRPIWRFMPMAATEDRAIAVRWIASLPAAAVMRKISKAWGCVGQIKELAIAVGHA